MCGIAGYFGSREISPEIISKCLHLMHRRGPDSQAAKYWKNAKGKNIYFLHARLKIIDLEDRANQPFHIGSKYIIFNGELYNYLEIRRNLEQKACRFVTHSDTEVLLRTIDQEGWSSLDRCEGMWAFAVYDEKDGSLTLCRDRFGEKPLYIYEEESGIYFGSEVKFIVALLGKRLPVNFEHLYRYLVNGYKSLYKNGHTFFNGLSELSSASYLRFDSSGTKTNTLYWRPHYRPGESMSYKEAVDGVKDRLIQSVKLRLRADVPLAFCMSGGVDSNALISIAKNVFNYDVHGFTIANTDARYEEQTMIDYAVKEQKLQHTSIPVSTKNFISKLRTLVRQHDAPVYTITYFAHWLLMESIHQHGYRISISGTAADEIFTGYYDHHLAYLYEIQGDLDHYTSSKALWEQHIRPLVRNPHLRNPDLFIQNPSFRDHIFLDAAGFSQYLVSEWLEPFQEQTFTESLLRNRMMNEMFHENVPVILHEDDHNAMYFSIENRSPYLDRDLFEFCFQIPSKHLVHDGLAKVVLRDAMAGIMPEQIRMNRRKVGFNAPIFSFLDVSDPQVRSVLLDQSPIFNYVQRHRIEKLVKEENLPNSKSKFLFYFLSSKIFLEEFCQ